MTYAPPPSYYEVLGVARDATPDQIRKAFRVLARTNHPDVGGDSEQFKQISQAHNVLSDPARRRTYDLQLNLTPVVQFTQPAPWQQDAAQRVEDLLDDAIARFLREQRQQAAQQARTYPSQPSGSSGYYRSGFVPPRYAPPPLRFERIDKTRSRLAWGIAITSILAAASTIFLMVKAIMNGFMPYYILFSTMSNPDEGSLAPILLMIIGGILAFFAGVIVRLYVLIAGKNYDLYWFVEPRIKILKTALIYLGVVGGLFIGHVFF